MIWILKQDLINMNTEDTNSNETSADTNSAEVSFGIPINIITY